MPVKLTLEGQEWFEAGYRPGAYALVGGVPPAGTPRKTTDFWPNDRYSGTPQTHAQQQQQAVRHALSAQGFDDRPVQFLVHWSWFDATLFTADKDGWRQGK